MRSAGAIDGQAFTETWYRTWKRDAPGWVSPPENCPDLDASVKHLRECTDFEPSPFARGRDLARPRDPKANREIESFALYHSPLYQKILFVNAWHETLRLRVQRKPDDLEVAIDFPPINAMVPSSIRSLLFAHWIRGRTLTWTVINDCAEPDFNWTKTKRKEDHDGWLSQDELLYSRARRAAHNLYRAHYYIRQMCGNDQDVMFPSPASVFYSLWRLIHTLVLRELGNDAWSVLGEFFPLAQFSAKMRVQLLERLMGVGRERFEAAGRVVRERLCPWYPDWHEIAGELLREIEDEGQYPRAQANQGDAERYSVAVCTVRQQLADRSDHATPGQYFDYRFVTERVLTYLREVEQLGDLSSRARAAVLRGKYFLSDDYEDPRFHLDWSMIQLMAPTAALMREHVIAERRKIFDSEDDG